MDVETNTLKIVLDAINEIKKTGFEPESVDLDFYLGGDLGVDSREMLEIWYELEQRLPVRIMDEEKRDMYTLGDVTRLLEAKLQPAIA